MWRYTICQYVYCADLLCVTRCFPHISTRESAMAARKKTETINLRVSSISKNLLEGMSNFLGKTSTQVVEDLLGVAAKEVEIRELGEIIDTNRLDNQSLDLPAVVAAAHVDDDPVLTKLRTFYIAPCVVSARDKLVISTVLESIDMFSGQDELFFEEDIPLKSNFRSLVPMLNLQKINSDWPILEEFILFRSKNKNLNPSFSAFLKLTGRG